MKVESIKQLKKRMTEPIWQDRNTTSVRLKTKISEFPCAFCGSTENTQRIKNKSVSNQ